MSHTTFKLNTDHELDDQEPVHQHLSLSSFASSRKKVNLILLNKLLSSAVDSLFLPFYINSVFLLVLQDSNMSFSYPPCFINL